MKSVSTLFFCLFLTSGAFAQETDLLLQRSLKTSSLKQALKNIVTNIKPLAENFQIKLDSGSKITSPQVVSGTLLQPVLKATVKKCVFIFCQEIELDVEFTLREVNGSCDSNYQLSADLQRSSQMLTDLYSFINTSICINKTATGDLTKLQVDLVRANSYSSGAVQKQAFSLIKLQGDSILESFKKVLALNGINDIVEGP